MPEITSRLSTALADRYRICNGGMTTVYAAVVLGACFSSPQPPPLQPSDIANMPYPEVRTWLETWMVGARDPKGILALPLPNDPQQRGGERAWNDPRKDSLLPGTPTGLSLYRGYVVDRAVVRGCQLELFPGGIIIRMHGVDSLSVDDKSMYFQAPFHVPWFPDEDGQPQFRRIGIQFQFGSSDFAEQASLVWRRAAQICSESQAEKGRRSSAQIDTVTGLSSLSIETVSKRSWRRVCGKRTRRASRLMDG